MTALLIRNATLPDGRQGVDLLARDGRFEGSPLAERDLVVAHHREVRAPAAEVRPHRIELRDQQRDVRDLDGSEVER